jgi:hypothetical protein
MIVFQFEETWRYFKIINRNTVKYLINSTDQIIYQQTQTNLSKEIIIRAYLVWSVMRAYIKSLLRHDRSFVIMLNKYVEYYKYVSIIHQFNQEENYDAEIQTTWNHVCIDILRGNNCT